MISMLQYGSLAFSPFSGFHGFKQLVIQFQTASDMGYGSNTSDTATVCLNHVTQYITTRRSNYIIIVIVQEAIRNVV